MSFISFRLTRFLKQRTFLCGCLRSLIKETIIFNNFNSHNACNWLKNLTQLSLPVRVKIKIICNLLAYVFPRLVLATCICIKFLLAHWIACTPFPALGAGYMYFRRVLIGPLDYLYTFSRAWRRLHVFSSSSHWSTGLSVHLFPRLAPATCIFVEF